MKYRHKITGEEVEAYKVGCGPLPDWFHEYAEELITDHRDNGALVFVAKRGDHPIPLEPDTVIARFAPECFNVCSEERFLAAFYPADKHDAPVHDPVLAPRHYRGDGTIECKHAAQSMMHGVLTKAEKCTPMSGIVFYWWGCAFKYLWRWPWKNGLQDLKKCRETLDLLIDELEES